MTWMKSPTPLKVTVRYRTTEGPGKFTVERTLEHKASKKDYVITFSGVLDGEEGVQAEIPFEATVSMSPEEMSNLFGIGPNGQIVSRDDIVIEFGDRTYKVVAIDIKG